MLEPMTVYATDIEGSGYQVCDLGVHYLAGSRESLWLQAADNPENVAQVLVDRIWLILEESEKWGLALGCVTESGACLPQMSRSAGQSAVLVYAEKRCGVLWVTWQCACVILQAMHGAEGGNPL